jgi:zinc transport system substrate-binding protein
MILILGAALVLSGCAAGGEATTDGGVRVVASFYPLAEAAARVGGARADVTNLTPAGAEPHDFELAPDDVQTLLEADLVAFLGGGFQPAVEDVVDDRDGPSVDLLAELQTSVEGDPHVWLDPILMAEISTRIAGALTEADPGGAEAYRVNAERYRGELRALHERFRAGLATCESRTIVTSHAAFGHLAARYGLEQRAITGLSPELEPDPARLAELAELIRAEDISVVFTETLLPAEIAEALAREADVEVGVLNPLEGLLPEEEARGETYVSIMEENLESLRAGLGCK